MNAQIFIAPVRQSPQRRYEQVTAVIIKTTICY